MLFNSYVFLFGFLPLCFLGFAALKRTQSVGAPVLWLTASSLIFYGFTSVYFLGILSVSVLINLGFARLVIHPGLSKRARRLATTSGVVFNISVLLYFKYFNFFIDNLNALANAGISWPTIALPIGISFITFQKIAFLVDAYRGRVARISPRDYLFFVTFFPQLIAGPIVHHSQIFPQIASRQQRDIGVDLAAGLSIFAFGLFKKVILADSLAVYADAGYEAVGHGRTLDFASAWIVALAYSFQLYFDFSGYSDMAVGLALMFGIYLPANFNSPYKSRSIVDFWRRWHITLSDFLREYLYIPLGGGRSGTLRRHANLMLTMLIGGLWHGANWTFVLWGGIHGALLVANHLWRATSISQSAILKGRVCGVVGIATTFAFVTLAWVPFRASSIGDAFRMFDYLVPTERADLVSVYVAITAQFKGLLDVGTYLGWFKPRELWPADLPPNFIATVATPSLWVVTAGGFVAFFCPNTTQFFSSWVSHEGRPRPGTGGALTAETLGRMLPVAVGFMLALAILKLGKVSPFLYFQF